MAPAEGHFPVGRSPKSPDQSENAFLAIIACAFLLFNIMVGMMVHRAHPNAPGGQTAEVIASQGG